MRILFFCVALSIAAPACAAPNIVVVMIDDAGYNEYGFTGSANFQTPNIDAMAAAGTQFSQAYVAASVCSVSRAALLTGRYSSRYGFEWNVGNGLDATEAENNVLPLDEETIAESLAGLDYTCLAVGKWHLGYWATTSRPLKRGFLHHYGHLGGWHDYWSEEPHAADGHKIWRDDRLDGSWETEGKYLTDALADETVAFIDAHAADVNPFFLYVTPCAIHAPMQATQADLDQFPELTGEVKTRAAMMFAVDRLMGRLDQALTDNAVKNETYVFFVGTDNGGSLNFAGDNTPFRGGKATIYEGGHRTPFFVVGPDIPAATSNVPINTIDVLPTAVAIAGGTIPSDLDGINLLPHLTTGAAVASRPFYFRRGGGWAIVEGDDKLMRPGAGQPLELYDLAADPGETTNLAGSNQAKVDSLVDTFTRWELECNKARWLIAGDIPATNHNAFTWAGGSGNFGDLGAWIRDDNGQIVTLVPRDFDGNLILTIKRDAAEITITNDMTRQSGLPCFANNLRLNNSTGVGGSVTIDGNQIILAPQPPNSIHTTSSLFRNLHLWGSDGSYTVDLPIALATDMLIVGDGAADFTIRKAIAQRFQTQLLNLTKEGTSQLTLLKEPQIEGTIADNGTLTISSGATVKESWTVEVDAETGELIRVLQKFEEKP